MGLHTSRHTRKNSSFSTQDKRIVLLGLEALPYASHLHYATCSNYYKLGKEIATIVDRNQKGEKLQNIPIRTVKEPMLMINKTTADILQITISEDVLKKAVLVE